jgi:hypothetical protein
VLGLVLALVVGLTPPHARAQEAPARPPRPSNPAGQTGPASQAAASSQAKQALMVAESLGHLAATLRAYAQLAYQIEPEQAQEQLARSRQDFDASLERLLKQAARQMPKAEIERLQQRWRSVRDATYTRPAPEIGSLMSDIGGDAAGQLRALVPAPKAGAAPQRPQPLERAWQQQNLQWLAKEGLYGCWRPEMARLEETERLKKEFGQWLATQEKPLAPLVWVQYNAQWNLLTTSLPGAGSAGCTEQSMRSLVATVDRLTRMIATLP